MAVGALGPSLFMSDFAVILRFYQLPFNTLDPWFIASVFLALLVFSD
jgi:hypothetical protein